MRDPGTLALSYTPPAQECPQFRCDALLQPGTGVLVADRPGRCTPRRGTTRIPSVSKT